MDMRATVGHETLKKDGMRLFVETMAGKEVGAKLATDMQTLFESAWNQKGQVSGAMMLSRLIGYIEGMGSVVCSIHEAGVQFIPIEDEEGNLVSILVRLHPSEDANLKRHHAQAADLDLVNAGLSRAEEYQ